MHVIFLRFKRGIGLLYLEHSWIGFEEALNWLFAVKGTMHRYSAAAHGL